MSLRPRLYLSSAALLALAPMPQLALAQQAGGGSPSAQPSPAPTPTPTPAPSGPVQGPPDGLITPPAGGQTRPTVPVLPQPSEPVATPSSPTPDPAPTPAPTPAPSAAPAPSRTNTPTGGPANRASQRDESQTATTAPVAPSGDTPVSSDQPVTDAPPSAPVGTDPSAESTAAVPSEGGLPEWVPLALALVALLGGIFWLVRARKAKQLGEDEAPVDVVAYAPPPTPVPSPAPEPSPALPAATPPAPTPPTAAPMPAPTPSAPPVIPAAGITGRRAEIAIAFEPISATATLVNFRLRYAITLTNTGNVDADDIGVRMGVFAGTTANPFGVSQWFNDQREAAHQQFESIPAGGSHRFEGEVAAPLDAIAPVLIDGRRIAVPLLGVDVRYHHPSGESPIAAQTARAFVVGREAAQGGGGKLAPFRIDAGPADFDRLGHRDSGISQSS